MSAPTLPQYGDGLLDCSTCLGELTLRFGPTRCTAGGCFAQDVECAIGEYLGHRLELRDEIVVVHTITVVTVVACGS